MSGYAEMPAGRELDALVAERVMGWRLERTGGEGKYRDAMRWMDGPRVVHSADWHFRPSTDIADAWRVVEEMRRRGFHARLVTPFADGLPHFAGFTPHGVSGWNGRPDHEMPADTAPLAICRAALAAVSEGSAR